MIWWRTCNIPARRRPLSRPCQCWWRRVVFSSPNGPRVTWSRMTLLPEPFAPSRHLMPNKAKELYSQLRALQWEQLWKEEAARFDRAGPGERLERAAVIRAVGVVFSE